MPEASKVSTPLALSWSTRCTAKSSSGDDGASYPAHPEEKELSARIRQLKTDCYRRAERRLETSSPARKRRSFCAADSPQRSGKSRSKTSRRCRSSSDLLHLRACRGVWSRCLCSARCWMGCRGWGSAILRGCRNLMMGCWGGGGWMMKEWNDLIDLWRISIFSLCIMLRSQIKKFHFYI